MFNSLWYYIHANHSCNRIITTRRLICLIDDVFQKLIRFKHLRVCEKYMLKRILYYNIEEFFCATENQYTNQIKQKLGFQISKEAPPVPPKLMFVRLDGRCRSLPDTCAYSKSYNVRRTCIKCIRPKHHDTSASETELRERLYSSYIYRYRCIYGHDGNNRATADARQWCAWVARSERERQLYF